ncbi:hypothetical protein S83_038921, partial [Arachis hypogaea]
DIGKLEKVSKTMSQDSIITKLEILRPALTRFFTNFIALQSILIQKDVLKAM